MRHHIAGQLRRWSNVLFVELFPTKEPDRPATVNADERIKVYSPPPLPRILRRLYTMEPITHKLANRHYRNLLARAVAAYGYRQALLFNFCFALPEVMHASRFRCAYYICVDEFPLMAHQWYKEKPLLAWYQSRLLQHYENRVAASARRCFTPHRALQRKLSRFCPDTHLLIHAHDYDLTKPVPLRPRQQPIRVAFAGYIHYRLLHDWLMAVARESDMLLYLIGPLQDYPMNELLRTGRVHHVAPLKGNALREKLAEMDVLIIPYDPALPEVNVLTSTSKLFQYVAAGKPIVMSRLPDFMTLPHGLLYVAGDVKDFIAKIRLAHNEDSPALRQARHATAAANTWDSRGDLLHELIERDLRETSRGQ
jgi:hypothetical protein